MNIHEYQAKKILKNYGINVLPGYLATTHERAEKLAEKLHAQGIRHIAVKAQIHAGGRGKSGGIKFASTVKQVKKYAKEMLGNILVTAQTGSKSKKINKIYLEKCEKNYSKSYYFSMVVDRKNNAIACIVSGQGGGNIEEVSKKSPENIFKTHFSLNNGFQSFYARKLAFKLGIKKQQVASFIIFVKGIYKCFTELDLSLIEINPFVFIKEKLVALDAKMVFDNNALFRQTKIQKLYDPKEEDPKEIEAKKHMLNYVSLEGNVGCMVNGAGLAMATMDLIKLYGGNPANFLDVGGRADTEQITKAFEIILSDSNVKGILINIFGGIMKCDIIASGIVSATKTKKTLIPIVVRLKGTNYMESKKILEKAKLNVEVVESLDDAVKKILEVI